MDTRRKITGINVEIRNHNTTIMLCYKECKFLGIHGARPVSSAIMTRNGLSRGKMGLPISSQARREPITGAHIETIDHQVISAYFLVKRSQPGSGLTVSSV